jgi:rRNA-processing protein FCF1
MFDTAALIALERGHAGIRKVHRTALEASVAVVVITPVIAEWWRKGKREKERTAILRALYAEAPSPYVARAAGDAIGVVGAGVVDALVMASASVRGDVVYTSDLRDLGRLRDVFPNVTVERV